jgi:hypothetical protein
MSAAEYLTTLKGRLKSTQSENSRLLEEVASQQQVSARIQSKLKYKLKVLDEHRREADEAADTLLSAEERLAEAEADIQRRRQALLEMSHSLREKEFDLDSKQLTLAEERQTLNLEQIKRSKHDEAREAEIAELKGKVQRLKQEVRAVDSSLEAKAQERVQTLKNLEAAQTALARSTDLEADRLDNLEQELERIKEAVRSKKLVLMRRSGLLESYEEVDRLGADNALWRANTNQMDLRHVKNYSLYCKDALPERDQSWQQEVSFALEERPSLFEDLVERMAKLEEKLSKRLSKSPL